MKKKPNESTRLNERKYKLQIDETNTRMSYKVEELLLFQHAELVHEFCATCDTLYLTFVPKDPMDYYYHVLGVTLCESCVKKNLEGQLEISEFCNHREVEEYRKKKGLKHLNEARRIAFDRLHGNEDDYPLEDFECETFGVNPYAEDYYDPRADLMRDQARELGVR